MDPLSGSVLGIGDAGPARQVSDMDIFTDFDAADVRALIEGYPLAWVAAPDSDIATASLLPLIGEFGEDGSLRALIGHLARRNPLHARLAETGRATILFNGPSGYVSPEHAGRRDWAPTWNYAQLRIAADVRIDTDLTDLSLDVLVEAMERGRATPWSRDGIAERYSAMAGAIIGFRAEITALEGRFKLGQDEKVETLRAILASHPDPDLVRWMRRFNQGRC